LLSGTSKTHKEEEAKLTIFHGKNKKNAGSKPALQSPYLVKPNCTRIAYPISREIWGEGKPASNL